MQFFDKNQPKNPSSVVRIAYMGLAIALALIFSYIEASIPILPTIPGIKLGLSNSVVLIMFFLSGARDAAIVAVIKTIVSAFLFSGIATLLYGLVGIVCAFLIMWLLWRFKWSIIGISMAGALAHNTGQIFVAILVLKNVHVLIYYPALIIVGLVVGLLTGIIAKLILKHLRKTKDTQ